eukprot:gene3234-2154_t
MSGIKPECSCNGDEGLLGQPVLDGWADIPYGSGPGARFGHSAAVHEKIGA